jgi:DNA-directed RNA polymerase specialized sigma24 family protein
MTERQALAALDEEWRELAVLRLPGRAGRDPELAGATDLGSVLGLVRQRPDAVLAALLRLGAEGESWAYRTVLQTMLGKAVLLCARRPEVLPDAISELWLAIVEYPLERRPTSIAANLAWAVHRRLPRPVPWRPWGALDPPTATEEAPDAASTLAEARRLGLIDECTHRTLWTVYVAGRSSAQAAADLATTPELVRWRCSRALRRLRAQADLLCA